MKINWFDLEDVLSGEDDQGLIRHMISPFDKVLTEEEAAQETMMFVDLSPEDQEIIQKDFESFFRWFGSEYLPISLFFKECHDLDAESINISLKVNRGSLCERVKGFLEETDVMTLFHIGRGAIVILNYDMTAFVICEEELSGFPEMERVKVVQVKLN